MSLLVGDADVSLKTIGKGTTWVTLKTKADKPVESPAISVEATKLVCFPSSSDFPNPKANKPPPHLQ